MFFSVSHTTIYTYSQPIALGPHIIRLKPRSDGSQRLLDFHCQIDPAPTMTSECLDPEGNVVIHAWFSGSTDSLRVITSFTVETLRCDPFDYLLEPGFSQLPASYEEALQLSLSRYCSEHEPSRPVLEFVDSLTAETEAEPLAFLKALNERLYRNFQREIRDQGSPQSPETTLSIKKGACRDLTVLFMAACRAQGLAARFVSGYHKGDPARQQRYLHAWPEVYLPGGGWRGFDPTRGAVVADAHVPLAAAQTPAGTMPIHGTFSGPPQVSSTLDFELKIAIS